MVEKPDAYQAAKLASDNLRHGLMAAFERVCEAVTTFVSGHWGTLTAVVLVVIGTIVFLQEEQQSFSDKFEHFLTMLSLALLFLLQRSQTKDTLSLQIKLNELLRVAHLSDERVINVERKSEDNLKKIHNRYQALHDTKAAGTDTPIGPGGID